MLWQSECKIRLSITKKIKQGFFFFPAALKSQKNTVMEKKKKKKKGGTSALLPAHRESNCRGFFLHV